MNYWFTAQRTPSSYKSYKNHCAMFALQLKNILQISNNRKVLRNFFFIIFSPALIYLIHVVGLFVLHKILVILFGINMYWLTWLFSARILVNKASAEFVLKPNHIIFFIHTIEHFKLVNYFVYNNLHVDSICTLDSLLSTNTILWYILYQHMIITTTNHKQTQFNTSIDS